MKRKTTVIRHPSELSELSVLPVKRMPGRGRIVIADDRLDAQTREAWEATLNKRYFACGCDRAAVGLALGVLGAVAWIIFRPGPWSSVSGGDMAKAVGVVIASAGLGKALGLLGAEGRLKEAVGDVRGQWKAPDRPASNVEGCG